MNGQTALAIAGGIGTFLAPAVFVQLLLASQRDRAAGLVLSLGMLTLLLLSLVAAAGAPGVAALAFAATALCYLALRRRRRPDIVVDDSLLKDAVSPELTAKLTELETRTTETSGEPKTDAAKSFS